MKLLHQINLAFGLLLVVILGATAVLIHYVLLDHLIVAQKQELRTISTRMTTTIQHAEANFQAVTLESAGALQSAEGAIEMARLWVPLSTHVQAIVADEDGNVVSEGTPVQQTFHAAASGTSLPLPLSDVQLINSERLQALQAGKDSRFLVETSPVAKGTLTLITPMSKVNALEQALFSRLLIVLAIGGVLVLVLSLVITRKLIHPLIKLQDELKKVRQRQFADVALVEAQGEIGAVARTVHELARELDQHNKAQKQFFQNASHELKTPLMSIAGYAEGIRDGVFEGEQSRKGLDIILSESSRLKRIVSEMTLLAKLDSEEHSVHVTAVPVRSILTETAERINPLLVQNGLELSVTYGESFPNDLTVRADEDKLLQALLNVLANATRHAKRHIAVHAKLDKQHVVITVADDGPGIAEQLLPHLFHRFVKGKDGENGLGLAISRAIVERCGGRIEASNRPEGGAQFALRLPKQTKTAVLP